MSLKAVTSVSLVVALSALVAACSSVGSNSIATDPLNTPQEVQLQSPEREASLIEANEKYLGMTIEETGFTRSEFLSESYRWCAMLSAVGRDEANRFLRSEVERIYPPDQVEVQLAFVEGANLIIEEHLCS